jgi:hypothetical protein
MLKKFALTFAVAGGLGLAVLATAPAGAAPAAPGLAPIVDSNVDLAQARRCHVRRNSRWVRCYPRRYYRPYYHPYYRPYPPAPWPFFPLWPWW